MLAGVYLAVRRINFNINREHKGYATELIAEARAGLFSQAEIDGSAAQFITTQGLTACMQANTDSLDVKSSCTALLWPRKILLAGGISKKSGSIVITKLLCVICFIHFGIQRF